MPHVFVADVATPELEDEDRHHLERVLRVRVGEEITVTDGRGGWRTCRFTSGASLEPTSPVEQRERPSPAITVAFAVTKSDKPELVVQKLTELGVDRIVAFSAGRSVARWEGDRAERHVARLQKVARGAAMQSRRAYLPLVDGVVDFATAAAIPGAALADAGGGPPSMAWPVVLVGPEGGWTAEERAVGIPTVALGGQILRSETAAIAAGTLLAALRAGLVEHARSLRNAP